MKIIKLKIFQPNAHYRVSFSYLRKFTYPIPPISTIKGYLCNLLGIKDKNDINFEKFINNSSIAIYGKFDSISKDYIWYRNLALEDHKKRFGSENNRSIENLPQSFGGQAPTKIDIINNNNLMIYIYNKDEDFQKKIFETIKNPINRNSSISIGRSEDWIVYNEIKEIYLEKDLAYKIPYYYWLPSEKDLEKEILPENYLDFYNNANGNLMKMPVYYEISDEQERIFKSFVNVKLCEGSRFIKREFYIDKEEENLPILLCKLKKE